MSKYQVIVVKLGKHFDAQSKHSDSLLTFVDCQEDREKWEAGKT